MLSILSILYAMLTLLCCLPTLLLDRLCTAVTGDQSYMHSSSIGYSGVLFAYAGMEAFHSTQTSRSVFGIFSVPTKAYPFILLIVLQVRN